MEAYAMGGACARCSEVKKGAGETATTLPPKEFDEAEITDGEEDDQSEVAASSDEEENQEDYKQGVEEILKTTGKNLKRGKTMAMKEAISTAKKYGLEGSKINEAQRQLDEHIRQQCREQCEREVEAFFASPAAGEIPQVKEMVKKASEAEVSSAVLKRVQEHLDMLLLCRPLEDEERGLAREALKQSCRELVLAATQGGRPATLLNLEDGSQEKAVLSLDPPLRILLVTGLADSASKRALPVGSLSAVLASDEKRVNVCPHFKALESDERECAVAVRFTVDSKEGVLCLLEPTQVRRDRLIEGLVILAVTCG